MEERVGSKRHGVEVEVNSQLTRGFCLFSRSEVLFTVRIRSLMGTDATELPGQSSISKSLSEAPIPCVSSFSTRLQPQVIPS